MTTELTPTEINARLKALGLFGLIACCEQIIDKPWLREVLAIEERERQKRGFERPTRDAHVGAAKPMIDFDWAWPKKIDRQAYRQVIGSESDASVGDASAGCGQCIGRAGESLRRKAPDDISGRQTSKTGYWAIDSTRSTHSPTS